MFSNEHLAGLIHKGKLIDAKRYLSRFFFKYGTGVFFRGLDGYTLYTLPQAQSLIGKDSVKKRTGKKVKFSAQGYLESSEFRERDYHPTVDYTKPDIFTVTETIRGHKIERRYVNMIKPLPFDATENKDIEAHRKDMSMIHKHIRDVLCSGSQEQYEYVVNFLACSFAGRKLRKALYFQSTERTGKGLLLNFCNAILGQRMVKTNSLEVMMKYTKRLEGACLVNFDDLVKNGSYMGDIADSFKALVTEPMFESREMWQPSYLQRNTFNLIFTTNNDQIIMTQSNKDRLVPMDVSECRKGDHKYFASIAKIVNDPEVQKAFYHDMIRHYNTYAKDWNEENVPVSKTKQRKIYEALPICIKYLKEQYVTRGKGVSMPTKQFFEIYYDQTKDKASKQRVGRYLTELDIVPKRVQFNGKKHYRYEISHKDLLRNMKKKDWWDAETDLIDDDDEDEIAELGMLLDGD